MAIRRFFEQAYLYHKGRQAAFNAEEFVLLEVGYPLLTMIFHCLIASYCYGTNDLGEWVVGNSFLLCVNSCIVGLGIVFMNERYTGRIRSIIASPCNKIALILANGIFPAILAIIASFLGLIVGVIVFQIDYSKVDFVYIFISIIVAMISASCFGLLLGVLGLLTDSMHMVLNMMEGLLLILTGAEFPIEQLPICVQYVSWSIPLTKSIKAVKGIRVGDYKNYWLLLLLELLSGIVYVVLARFLFAVVEKETRKKGSFDYY